MVDRKQVCIDYFNRARKRIVGTRGGLDKEFYSDGLKEIWHAFEAFLGWKYPNTSSTDRQPFYNEHEDLFVDWKMADRYNDAIGRLKRLCPISDMDLGNPKPDITHIDEKSLKEIVNAVNKVYCNLKHGGKNVREDRKDAGLVENSFIITYYLLERILQLEEII